MSKIPGVTLFALGGITLFSLFKLEVSIPKEIWQGRQPTQLEMELAVRKQTEIEREAAHRRKLEEMNAQRRLTRLRSRLARWDGHVTRMVVIPTTPRVTTWARSGRIKLRVTATWPSGLFSLQRISQ